MGRRMERCRIRREDSASTREFNRRFKTKERARRDDRMIERIKTSSPPYTPEVVSWMTAKLGKKAPQITEQDIAQLTIA